MQLSPTLVSPIIAQGGAGIFAALFWIFLVGAFIWLLIWLLLRGDLPESPAEDSTSEKAGEDSSEDAAEAEPVIETATAEEAASRFRAELDSGNARQDESLGILFNATPDDADDLKEISGVAQVLEGKLHDFGVYQFKQIAFWTETAMSEFAKRLSFKDRIYRENWIAQAKRLHESKYAEKL